MTGFGPLGAAARAPWRSWPASRGTRGASTARAQATGLLEADAPPWSQGTDFSGLRPRFFGKSRPAMSTPSKTGGYKRILLYTDEDNKLQKVITW